MSLSIFCQYANQVTYQIDHVYHTRVNEEKEGHTHDAVLVTAVLEIREELVQDTLLALLAADVARMALDVVDTAQIVDGDTPVAGLVQLLERLVHDVLAALTHRRLRKSDNTWIKWTKSSAIFVF